MWFLINKIWEKKNLVGVCIHWTQKDKGAQDSGGHCTHTYKETFGRCFSKPTLQGLCKYQHAVPGHPLAVSKISWLQFLSEPWVLHVMWDKALRLRWKIYPDTYLPLRSLDATCFCYCSSPLSAASLFKTRKSRLISPNWKFKFWPIIHSYVLIIHLHHTLAASDRIKQHVLKLTSFGTQGLILPIKETE